MDEPHQILGMTQLECKAFSRACLGMSDGQIADEIDRDRSTVSEAIRRVLTRNPELKKQIPQSRRRGRPISRTVNLSSCSNQDRTGLADILGLN